MFLLFILILKDGYGYESVQMGKLKTKVPKACRDLPQLSKRCMESNNQGSNKCKKLPTITKKCQELSESWQLLAETFQKVTKKKEETITKNKKGRKRVLKDGKGMSVKEKWQYKKIMA